MGEVAEPSPLPGQPAQSPISCLVLREATSRDQIRGGLDRGQIGLRGKLGRKAFTRRRRDVAAFIRVGCAEAARSRGFGAAPIEFPYSLRVRVNSLLRAGKTLVACPHKKVGGLTEEPNRKADSPCGNRLSWESFLANSMRNYWFELAEPRPLLGQPPQIPNLLPSA